MVIVNIPARNSRYHYFIIIQIFHSTHALIPHKNTTACVYNCKQNMFRYAHYDFSIIYNFNF